MGNITKSTNKVRVIGRECGPDEFSWLADFMKVFLTNQSDVNETCFVPWQIVTIFQALFSNECPNSTEADDSFLSFEPFVTSIPF